MIARCMRRLAAPSGQRGEGAAQVGRARVAPRHRAHVARGHAPGPDAAPPPRRPARSHPADASPTAPRRRARAPARAHGAGSPHFEATSSPTVGSSSTSRRGRCSSARAISTRRIWPPDSLRAVVARAVRQFHLRQHGSRARAPRLARRRCRAGPRGTAGSPSPRGRDRACAPGTPRRAGAAPRPAPIAREWPSTLDAARVRVEQPGDQREQRGLARAVQARAAP